MTDPADKILFKTRSQATSASAEFIEDIAYFFLYAREGLASYMQRLIDAGIDVNAQDGDGMTALHHAAASGARPCIRVLVKSGKCDYLIKDHMGRYASELAIQWARDYAVARLLSKHQARQAYERGVPAYVLPEKR